MKKAYFLLIFLIALSLIPSVKANSWVSPTDFTDVSGDWLDEEKSYDDVLATYSYHLTKGLYVWTGFLELLLEANITSDKLRVYFSWYGSTGVWVDLDVYLDGVWVGLHDALWTLWDQWVEKSYAEGQVSKLRVRMRSVDFTKNAYLRIKEIDFWEVEEAPPQEYSFTFYEISNVSASSSFWKAKMFSGIETVSISSDSNIWKEKGFYMTETITVNNILNVLKAKLLSITETMSSTSSFYSTFEVVEEEREENGGSGGGFLYSVRKPLALFVVIIVLVLGYFWISPDSQKERKTIRKPKPTVEPRKPVSTLQPRKHKGTTKARKHKSTLEPRKHKKTTKPRKHKKNVKPRKQKR